MVPPSAPESGSQNAPCAIAWLSRGLPHLFDVHRRIWRKVQGDPPPPRFDVLIVGSGYGGSVAAASLAGYRLSPPNGERGRRLRIAVLERGHEYLPGAFPSQLSELPGHVRFSLPGATSPGGVRTGLFDVRIGADVVAVVASGLGGGSLINAGVMLPTDKAVLAEARWPLAIRSNPDVLTQYSQRIAQRLGASRGKRSNTINVAEPPAKFRVMQARAGKPVPITVAITDTTSSAGVTMEACCKCGDCATGCNHGAKGSLDINLLVHARRHGVRIYTGATVLRLEQIASGWSVVVNHTDKALRQRQKEPLRIEADRVILAAGTFGSTEILMRSRPQLRVSSRLGQQFSGNGDLFAAAYNMPGDVNAVAHESQPTREREVGPTITAAIDDRQGGPQGDNLSIQELAVPGPLRRLFQEAFTTARTLHSLGQRDQDPRAGDAPDPNAVDDPAFRRALPIALIGRDSADGEIVPVSAKNPHSADEEGDGTVYVRWPGASDDPRFDDHYRRAERRLAPFASSGRLLPNPLWKLLPDDEARTLGIARGPLLTVHPLGGCPMGDDARSGVVNHVGQVFRDDPREVDGVYENLVVLDGSIVPTSLGINPALTIAALALRAIETLRGPGKGNWNLFRVRRKAKNRRVTNTLVRPIFRKLPRTPEVATEVQLIERLGGVARLADGHDHWLELTLHSKRVALADLMSPTGTSRRIVYDPAASGLRVFNRAPSAIDDDPRGSPGQCDPDPTKLCFEARAKVEGSLDILQAAPTGRRHRTLLAWAKHRGLRDYCQTLAEKAAGLAAPIDPMRQPPHGPWRLSDPRPLASRAAAVRTLDYTLSLSDFEFAPGFEALFGPAATSGGELEARGRKTLTYDGRSSPWQQLMELSLNEFPGQPSSRRATLSLDLKYFARQGVPLLRVVGQQDQVRALVDVASFCLYMVRTLLDGHLWSFRLPDRVPDRVINRLPGLVQDLPFPQVTELKVATSKLEPGKPVHLRLTRYQPSKLSDKHPVLLIHGYSASGTTFVHPTLRPGLAGRLVKGGRDVWILDLRSSAGMPGRAEPWTFEEIGCEDIPLAVDHLWRVCGSPADVVAHCMGSAMLCMALLREIPKAPASDDLYSKRLHEMRARIRRIVLSQVGPLVVMSPTNQARAFLMRYVKQLFPMGEYSFRPDGAGSMVDMLVDRLLATLPYPPDEFRRENPLWPPWAGRPWVRTRRRIDILYGQVFKLANMSDATLDYLDDFFGPMNVETVSQVIHFARTRAITDVQGRHVFATHKQLATLQHYDILSIHGRENGLVDISTADLLKAELSDRYHAACFDGFGHQDCLIGENTEKIFDAIVGFLDGQNHRP